MIWGLDIGGTKCTFVEGDTGGTVTDRKEVATADYKTWEALLYALLPEEGEAAKKKPRAMGVCCGGPLDERQGLILSPPNLPGWDHVPIVEWLKKRYGIPVFLRNDANACAVAEWLFGAGKGTKNMIFLTFGTGLGAGLILNGHLYCGTNGMAGEIGHVRAREDGPIGYGKSGSYEGFCSGGGIRQMAGGKSAKEVVELAENGDIKMQEILKVSAEILGNGVSILIDLFNPECVVIGGIFTRAQKWFRLDMEKAVARESLFLSAQVCRVVPAKLGEQLGDVAALSVAILGLRDTMFDE